MSELSEEEKLTFKRATERRRAAGVRLKRFAVMCDASQVEALNELWDSWTERLGKTVAVDHLINLMAHSEARMQDQAEQKRRKHAKAQT
jgi:hypothetical protein